MNCRDFIIEFEDRRGNLTEAATLHVKICAGCQKTSREQTQVWMMIDNLRRVDAPNDFDFRVKARIANAKPVDFQPRFFPILRYVLPIGLVVLVLGVFAFNTSFFFGSNTAPQVAVSFSPTPSIAESPATVNFSTPEPMVATVNPPQPSPGENIVAESSNVKPTANEQGSQFIAANSTRRVQRESRRNASDDFNNGAGSRVIAGTLPSVLVPEEFSSNKPVAPSMSAGNQNPITDVQILNFIGIETVSEKGGKRVKSVKPDSLAERSDVRVGDVIEAIDGKRIGEKPLLMETFESKKLTVVRAAKKIEIVLQNKSN
jgi:hypothetical protein